MTTPTTAMSRQKLLTQSLLKSTCPLKQMLEVWIAIFCLMATNYALSIFGLSL